MTDVHNVQKMSIFGALPNTLRYFCLSKAEQVQLHSVMSCDLLGDMHTYTL